MQNLFKNPLREELLQKSSVREIEWNKLHFKQFRNKDNIHICIVLIEADEKGKWGRVGRISIEVWKCFHIRKFTYENCEFYYDGWMVRRKDVLSEFWVLRTLEICWRLWKLLFVNSAVKELLLLSQNFKHVTYTDVEQFTYEPHTNYVVFRLM